VLGCHSKLLAPSTAHFKIGSCRDQWPANIGTACLCYGTYGYYEDVDINTGMYKDFNYTNYRHEGYDIQVATETGRRYGYRDEKDVNGEHECIATCADGIQNNHIRRSSGTGLVTASCPQGTTVLGCGSSAQTDSKSRRRATAVATATSCRCYDVHQVTCYAICGVLVAENSYPGTKLMLAGYGSSAVRVCCDSQLESTMLFVLGFVRILFKQD